MNIDIRARLIFVGVIGWFFARNVMMPLAFDDYSYAFVWESAGNLVDGAPMSERITSISDIIRSQWTHYFVWGGRTVAHCLVQLFMSMDKIVFDILNTAMFGALILLIVRLANVRFSAANLLWIVFGLWLAVPQFMYGLLWLTGACNYLWTTVIQLTFIYFFTRPPALCSLQEPICFSHPPTLKRLPLFKSAVAPLSPFNPAPQRAVAPFTFPFAIALGLLAGWSNEAGAGVAILLSIYFTVRNQHRQTWQFIAIAAAMIGLSIMVLAPGNLARMQHIFPDGFHFTTAVLIEHSKTFIDIIAREAFLFIPLILSPKTAKKMAPFIVAAILIPAAMMFSPLFKDYAGFASPIYLLIASVAAIDSIHVKRFRIAIRAGVAILTASMIFSLVADYQLRQQTDELFRLIDDQRRADCVKVPPMKFDPTLDMILGDRILNHYVSSEFGNHVMGLNQNPDAYYNRAVANYYGLKNIVLEAPR